MSSNVNNLSELENVLCDNIKTYDGILHFISVFKTGRFWSLIEAVKSKGWSVSILLFSLVIFRLRGESIHLLHRNTWLDTRIDDNTFYRLMNNSWMDWRKLLLGFAKQFAGHVKSKGGQTTGSVTCFVVDDTDIPKTGKTVEFIGRVFNHVTKQNILGFKLLLLAYWDGKSLISLDFSLHAEKGRKGNYGLNKKELKGRFKKERDKKSPSIIRVRELDEKKTDNTIAMLKRAVKHGFMASYVLMDSWFVNDTILKGVRAIKKGAIHLLGMCKMDNRKYLINDKELNSHQIITKYERKNGKYSRKYKSRYISIVANYKGEPVKLFLIRYNNASKWTLLLTTDLSLSFVEAIEKYQIRWTIEVLFKECKQYLRLGKSQNTDFDGQIADATLTLVTHTILTLHKRFSAYETMGQLYRQTQQNLIELTLWERMLKIFTKMLIEILEVFSIDPDQAMERLMKDEEVGSKLRFILLAIDDYTNNHKKTVVSVI